MSEVRQTVKIATPGTVNFKVKVKNDTWNRIGYGYSNPCYDPYQVKLTSSDGATPADTGRRVPTTTTGNYVNDNIDLSITTTAPNAVVTISLFGLDAGYWAGNYGPIFYEASLTTPDSASSNASASATSGSTSFTVEVTDANGIKTTKTLTFNVASDISITTKTVGGANKGASYTQALTASGGSAPLTWALASGTLPTGLTLSSSGTISGTTSNSATSQTVSISVTDSNGASVSQSYTLNVLSGVPGAPTSLTLGTIGNATVPLTWTAPTDNGGSAITNYIINYVSGKGKTDDQEEGDDHEEDEDKGSVSVSATGLTFPYSLTGLKNGRTYSITVSAKNANATSATSNAVTAIPAKPAGAPQSLSLILANGGIAIRWKKPSDSGGLKIDSYQVQCRKSTDADVDANWKTLTNRRDQNSEKVYSLLLDSTSTEITVAKGNSYHCRVRTKTTKSGVDYYGAWATTTNPLAFVSVPSAPVISAVDSTTATTKVKVTWAQSTDDGGSTINSYIASVAKKKDNGEDEDEKRSCTVNKPNSGWSAGNQECTITGVPTKGSFTVQVVAVNNAGQSEADTETVRILGKTQSLTYASRTYTKTIGDSDFSIGVTSNSGLKLKYSIDNNDVCTITDKGLIKVKKVGTCRITITQSGKADDDDDDDSNNKSDSDWEPITGTSQYVDVTVNPAAPSVPSWVSVTPGDSQVVAKWNAPKAPNNTVSEYVIEYALASGGGWTTFNYDTSTVVTTLNVTGLTNGTAYKFKLAAKNGTASSSSVEMPGSFTPAAVPSKPTIDSATSYPDTSTVLIAWTAPNNNGSAITNFTVTGTASGQSNVTCSTGGSGTSCAVTGVKNKNPYTFSLVAKNAIGTSSTSDTVTVSVAGVSQTITLNQTPASTGWNVGDPDMQIDAGSSSGLPLQYSVVSSAICTVSTGGSVHFVSDGTCKININQDGTNSATGNGSATKYSRATAYGPIELVVAPAVPSAPTITSVTNTVNGLVVAWSAPSRGGGTMSYVITGIAAGKSNETCSTSSLTCTIAVASKGTRYGFTAIANNGVDSSTASAVVYGTWQVVPTSPNTSGTSSAASTSDGKAIDVYWTKSTSDGGSAILRYTVSAVNGGTTKTCQIARTDTLDSNGYNCSITGLTPGTTYTVTVIATNSIGNSSTLSIGSITPGKSQSITVSSGTSITKTYGDSDFQISATVNSGQTPTYTASGSGCSASSSGLVHILAVSSCSIEVSQSGGGASEFLAATPVTVTVTINYAAPTKAVITKAAPASGSVILAWSAPSFNGGGTLSYQAFAKVGSTTVSSCSTSSLTCTISSLTDNTEYTITVVATNSGSLSSTSDEVLVSPYTNARAPMPLTATGGNKSTSHTWQAPSAYDGNLHHYVVYYRVAGSGSGFTAGITTSDTATVSGSISGLANNTRYEFYATAWVESATVLSEGNATAHVFATTLDVPTAPLNVSGSSVYVASGNTSTATISWNAPTGNGGSPITGYTVTATSGATSSTCTSTSATTCNITGLAPGTAYSVTVKATNAVGDSVESSAHSLTTVAPASAPTSATASGNSTTGLVTISWTVPASNGGNTITSYVVTAYQAGSATSYTCTVAGASSTSCILSGLPFKTAYTFKVAAVTAAGTGASSDATNEVTLVRSQAITFGSITNQDFNVGSIALTATTDSGLGITYTATPASICTVSGAVLTFVSIGACTVAANAAANDYYTAATEVSNTFNINAITPSAVTLLQVNPGASKLTVSWSQASNLGGSTLKHYVLSWATKTDFSDEQTLTTTNYTNVEITGLEAKTGYIVRVSVVTNDAQDASAWSNKLSATTFGAPAAPTIGTATVTSSGIVTVTWTDVPTNNNGGTPITGYVAEAYSVDGSTLTATGLTCSIGGGIQTCAISGLSGSTFYKFKVTASNAVGSATSEPTSDSVRPGTSQTLSITTVNTSHAANIVKLDGKSTSGLPVLYAVTSQTPTTSTSSSWGDGRSVCLVDSSGNLTVDLAGTCVITISQDGTDTGNNGAGTSYLPATDVTMTVTVAADKPSVIASFELVAGNSQITADWTSPEDDGGAPITNYLVTWFVSGGDRSNVPAGSTTAVTPVAGSYGRTLESTTTFTKTITGLTNGITYTVYVQAVNSAGAGPES
jgi:titin